MLAAEHFELLGVGGDRRISEFLLDFGRASKRGFQPRLQALPLFLGVLGRVPLAEPFNPAGGVN